MIAGVSGIMFVHCDDFMRKMYHMPWWHEPSRWKDAILPYFAAIGVPPHRVVRCLLARLPSGTTIPVHHDTGLWVTKTHRIHVPIVTDDAKVVFRAGHTEDLLQRYALTVGGVFELNNQSKHYVSNWAEPRMELRRLRRQAAATADAELCGRAMDMDRVGGWDPAMDPGETTVKKGSRRRKSSWWTSVTWGSRGGRIHLIFDTDEDGDVPPLEILAGEQLRQTRRSIDRAAKRARAPLSFVIIGAQKSGTTSVYEYLHEHPLVLRGVRRESTRSIGAGKRLSETVLLRKEGEQQQRRQRRTAFAALRGATRAGAAWRRPSGVLRPREAHAHPSCMSGDSTPLTSSIATWSFRAWRWHRGQARRGMRDPGEAGILALPNGRTRLVRRSRRATAAAPTGWDEPSSRSSMRSWTNSSSLGSVRRRRPPLHLRVRSPSTATYRGPKLAVLSQWGMEDIRSWHAVSTRCSSNRGWQLFLASNSCS